MSHEMGTHLAIAQEKPPSLCFLNNTPVHQETKCLFDNISMTFLVEILVIAAQ